MKRTWEAAGDLEEYNKKYAKTTSYKIKSAQSTSSEMVTNLSQIGPSCYRPNLQY